MAKKILIIDDEPNTVAALSIRLKETGHEIILASDGLDGLQKARKESPDLIILDVMLPKLDGYKVCRMLKFDKKYHRIPIVMYSARAQKKDVDAGMESGADAYVIKPFQLEAMVEKIRKFLGETK